MEDLLLLRVPAELGARLTAFTEGDESARFEVALSFANDRTASFALTQNGQKVNQSKEMFEGTLVDLPCIIETHKTFDNLSFFKTGDISQMLIVQSTNPSTNLSISQSTSQIGPNTPSNSQSLVPVNQPVSTVSRDVPPPIKYPSGLLPPTRDIRPKRFERETIPPKKIVSEVEQLLVQIRDELSVHSFRLIEEEVEIEVDEDEWENEQSINQSMNQSISQTGDQSSSRLESDYGTPSLNQSGNQFSQLRSPSIRAGANGRITINKSGINRQSINQPIDRLKTPSMMSSSRSPAASTPRLDDSEIDQSISQSIDQTINHSNSPAINKDEDTIMTDVSTNQSINQSIIQSIEPPTTTPIQDNESLKQSINQSINQLKQKLIELAADRDKQVNQLMKRRKDKEMKPVEEELKSLEDKLKELS